MHVVVVGAGHAGGSVMAFLRQYGFDGAITMIGAEPDAPYQRPPLSKAWLKGDVDMASLLLKPDGWYAEVDTDLVLGRSVVSIQRADRTVHLSDGQTLAYDVLVLATGARARKLALPGADLAGVLSLRTAADGARLKQALQPGQHLAIVGGGYVGLEVAATARALGVEVTVIEREQRCLARVASEPLSQFFQRYHGARGVRFELGADVAGLRGHGGRIGAITLGDGRAVDCDIALVGVGAVPNDELAVAAGLPCANGIIVDAQSRTADPAIFAIGDVAQRPVALYDRNCRFESVPNALEQAKQVACALTGRDQPAAEIPWFWSDQYALKLQIAGVPFDCDQTVIRGDPAADHFAVFHLANGVVRAVEAVNSPAEFMGGKQLIAKGITVTPQIVADLSISIKDMVNRTAQVSNAEGMKRSCRS